MRSQLPGGESRRSVDHSVQQVGGSVACTARGRAPRRAQPCLLHQHHQPLRLHLLLRIPGHHIWGTSYAGTSSYATHRHTRHIVIRGTSSYAAHHHTRHIIIRGTSSYAAHRHNGTSSYAAHHHMRHIVIRGASSYAAHRHTSYSMTFPVISRTDRRE